MRCYLEQFFYFCGVRNNILCSKRFLYFGYIGFFTNQVLLSRMGKFNFWLSFCLMFLFSCVISAQVNTLYYMENVPARSVLNPAFIPTQKFYIELPVVSGVAFSAGNNSVAAQDIVTKNGDEFLPALQPNADHSSFLNKLKPTINITTEYRTNLLGFGFRMPDGYFTFGISERYRMGINMPKSAVALAFDGTPDALAIKSYHLKKAGCDMTAYLEMAFGYSRKIDEDWTVGGKVKILFGEAHADLSFSRLGIDVSGQNIDIVGMGTARFTIPVAVSQQSNGLPYIQAKDAQFRNMLHPVGEGLGLDAGATYQYDDHIQLSASIDDIGFIYWKKSNWNASLKAQTSYNSWDFTLNNVHSNWAQQIGDSLQNSYTSSYGGGGYVTALTATTRLGADYSLLKKKIDFGLLFVNTFGGRYRYDELLASANFRPFYWFNASLSYGIINGNMGSMGVGLNFIGGPFNFFVTTDYLPLSYTDNGIPYKSRYVNGHVGLALTFNDVKRKYPCHCE